MRNIRSNETYFFGLRQATESRGLKLLGVGPNVIVCSERSSPTQKIEKGVIALNGESGLEVRNVNGISPGAMTLD
jgi:hypothetical protein